MTSFTDVSSASSMAPLSQLLHFGEIIAMSAHLFPDKAGATHHPEPPNTH